MARLSTARSLFAAGLVRNAKDPIKILGRGELGKKLEVHANKFTRERRRQDRERGRQREPACLESDGRAGDRQAPAKSGYGTALRRCRLSPFAASCRLHATTTTRFAYSD